MFKKTLLLTSVSIALMSSATFAAPASGLQLINDTTQNITVTCAGKSGWFPLPKNGGFLPTLPWQTLHDMFGTGEPMDCKFRFPDGTLVGEAIMTIAPSYATGKIDTPFNVDAKYTVSVDPSWSTDNPGMTVKLEPKQ